VARANPVRSTGFDLKYSAGGMVDIEFAVQFLVLAYAGSQTNLRANAGNIALLQRAQDCGLLPDQIGSAAASAYRKLRQLQHQARLDEASTQVDQASVESERNAGLALWQTLFGAAG
jgi:[glutamine synthetase] adenylyltransferase / [glutamine synthetase]-adenylyl-L-tyrosine phosphorylase